MQRGGSGILEWNPEQVLVLLFRGIGSSCPEAQRSAFGAGLLEQAREVEAGFQFGSTQGLFF
jgi:hypothetical protein